MTLQIFWPKPGNPREGGQKGGTNGREGGGEGGSRAKPGNQLVIYKEYLVIIRRHVMWGGGGGGWCLISRKRSINLQSKVHHYERVGWCQISRKEHNNVTLG